MATALAYAELSGRHGEARGFAGLTQGAMMELWSAADGAWTLLVTGPDGQTCIVAFGVSGQYIVAPAGERG
jgi:hypothetical protein